MRSRSTGAAVIMGLSPLVIVLTLTASLLYGAKDIPWMDVRHAFVQFDESNVNHQIIIHSRLPRAIGALLIGAFLAVSGAIMQGVTRNYLASPSIMGVSDGAIFAITLCMILIPNSGSFSMILYSLVGSALAAAVVYGLATLVPDGLSPVRLAILGTMIGTFLSSVAAALSTYFQVSQNVSFWYHARLHQLHPDLIKLALPFAIVGLGIALLISRSVTLLALGEEVAVGLGQRTALLKAIAALSVITLTGISVALAGNIGFVGLVIPHLARFLVGSDYRLIIPCSALLGAVFLGLCDIGSRFLNYPFETPIGVVTAIIGVPFFLYLIRTKGGGQRV